MDLFDYMRTNTMKSEAPLASRMRPVTLDEIVGQQHIIGHDKLLYRAIKADKLRSVIFYGPPGTGKTTIAKVIAHTTSAEFTQINATVAGKKDMEEVVRQAKDNLGMYGKRTILFVDEIHRFNKGQQDYLLPFVEDGTLILIGATTENPYFEVNGALLSRSIIFELKALEKEDIKKLLYRALTDMEKGMGAYEAVADEDALEFLAVSDTHMTALAAKADVVIPGTGFASTDGTYTNTERRLQLVQAAIEEDVELANWEIAAEIAHVFEVDYEWENTEDISVAMNDEVPAYKYAVVDEVLGGVLKPADDARLAVIGDAKFADPIKCTDSLMNVIVERLPKPANPTA